MPYFRSLGGAPLAEDFAPDIFGISQLETCVFLFFFFYLKDRQGMLAKPLQGQTVLPGKPRRLSCVSAPEGE